MIKAFGLGTNAADYEDALKEVREWLDNQQGLKTASIKVEGNKTTVTLPDGRFGVSRCNPCDNFDIITGIRVALDDIERKSRKLSLLEKQLVQTAFCLGAKNIRLRTYESETNSIEFTDDDFNILLEVENDDAFAWIEDRTTLKIADVIKGRL